jgi:hypothetical protein
VLPSPLKLQLSFALAGDSTASRRVAFGVQSRCHVGVLAISCATQSELTNPPTAWATIWEEELDAKKGSYRCVFFCHSSGHDYNSNECDELFSPSFSWRGSTAAGFP